MATHYFYSCPHCKKTYEEEVGWSKYSVGTMEDALKQCYYCGMKFRDSRVILWNEADLLKKLNFLCFSNGRGVIQLVTAQLTLLSTRNFYIFIAEVLLAPVICGLVARYSLWKYEIESSKNESE